MDIYTLVTNIGKAKIANATVTGSKVDFLKLKVGDGNGSYYEPSESQTDLVHTVWEGNVNNVLTGGENNPNWIIVQTVIPPGEGGFYVREAGIFDNDDNLLAISKYPESYKPSMEDGSTDDLTIELIFEVSNASIINLKIDPLVTTASMKDLNNLEAKINTQLKDIANDSYQIVEATGTNTYIGSTVKITSIAKGTKFTLFVGSNATGNCTINLNNYGAKNIKDSFGNIVNNIKANIPYNLCYNGTDFILQGKGGGGNATADKLLSGSTATVDSGHIIGTMTNQGNKTASLNCGGKFIIPAGYHNGSGKVTANSLASQTQATAQPCEIQEGKTAWVNGTKINGTMKLPRIGSLVSFDRMDDFQDFLYFEDDDTFLYRNKNNNLFRYHIPTKVSTNLNKIVWGNSDEMHKGKNRFLIFPNVYDYNFNLIYTINLNEEIQYYQCCSMTPDDDVVVAGIKDVISYGKHNKELHDYYEMTFFIDKQGNKKNISRLQNDKLTDTQWIEFIYAENDILYYAINALNNNDWGNYGLKQYKISTGEKIYDNNDYIDRNSGIYHNSLNGVAYLRDDYSRSDNRGFTIIKNPFIKDTQKINSFSYQSRLRGKVASINNIHHIFEGMMVLDIEEAIIDLDNNIIKSPAVTPKIDYDGFKLKRNYSILSHKYKCDIYINKDSLQKIMITTI
ncbi:phage tail protein [Clostridium sp. ZS6]|uniref:phage tail protein n=1 Tax=Clostridium sp. ZS6 TaxID=2949987 RepID=UPI00207ADA8D|nr:phage tail protein [Clostridium sp. ZS6]